MGSAFFFPPIPPFSTLKKQDHPEKFIPDVPIYTAS